MAGSVILYPFSIMKKASDMNSKLESIGSAISDTQKSYSAMESEEKLKGAAWSSVKGYIRDIQQPYLLSYMAWASEHKEALETYRIAGASLPDVQKLDKAQMENSIEKSKRAIQIQRSRKNPNYNIIHFYKCLINELREKINAMDTFIAAISGIFDIADSMHKVLVNASTELNKVKLSEKGDNIEYTELMSNPWICSMVVMAGMYGISQDGIKEDELAWLYEIGLTDNDIGIAYIRSKAQGDGDFIINFIRKDYNAAFASIEGDKAIGESSSMFVIKYFSGVSMLERELIENAKSVMDTIDINSLSRPKELRQMRIKELEDFTNAILGLRDPEKVMGHFTMIQNAAELQKTSIFFSILNSKVEIDKSIYRSMNEKRNELAALVAFFGSNAIVMNEQTSYFKSLKLNEAAIKNLIFNESTGTYYYDISYKGYGVLDVDGHTVTKMDIDLEDTIYTDIIGSTTELSGIFKTLELNDLYKKREELLKDSFENWMIDMSTFGLKDQIPLAGAVLELATSDTLNDRYSAAGDVIKESPLGNVEILNEFAESGTWDVITSNADSVMGYFSDKEDIDTAIKKYINEEEADWFSTGSVFYYGKEGDSKTRLISYGRDEPKIARAISKLEKDGLQKTLNLEYYNKVDGEGGVNKKNFEKNFIKLDFDY